MQVNAPTFWQQLSLVGITGEYTLDKQRVRNHPNERGTFRGMTPLFPGKEHARPICYRLNWADIPSASKLGL